MENTNELFEQIKLKKIATKNQNKTQKTIKVYGAAAGICPHPR